MLLVYLNVQKFCAAIVSVTDTVKLYCATEYMLKITHPDLHSDKLHEIKKNINKNTQDINVLIKAI